MANQKFIVELDAAERATERICFEGQSAGQGNFEGAHPAQVRPKRGRRGLEGRKNLRGGAFQYRRPGVKKNDFKPHLNEYWVISPKANAAFVAAMENVLEVYTRPHDPARPLVCLDETSKQLVAETRQPIPMQLGRPARFDYEYKRNGTANAFMLFAPLEGWRHVKLTERRTSIDYAQVLKQLSDIHFATADARVKLKSLYPAI